VAIRFHAPANVEPASAADALEHGANAAERELSCAYAQPSVNGRAVSTA
jgi:hypothetical protein